MKQLTIEDIKLAVLFCERMAFMEQNSYEYDPDPDAIEYWNRRKHGYQKLLAQREQK